MGLGVGGVYSGSNGTASSLTLALVRSLSGVREADWWGRSEDSGHTLDIGTPAQPYT